MTDAWDRALEAGRPRRWRHGEAGQRQRPDHDQPGRADGSGCENATMSKIDDFWAL